MNQEIINYLQVKPIDPTPYSDEREPLEQRIYRILTRTKFRSAAISGGTAEFVKSHIKIQIKSNQPIIIVYAMGGGRGIGTENFPACSWAEYLHLKFLSENLYAIGDIYQPGVEVRWSLDDYAARIFNNYQAEWQEQFISGFDVLLGYFTTISEGKITHKRIPTSTWYKDFNALKDKLLRDARSRADTPEAKEIIAGWYKRAQNNFYNADNLEGDELKKAIEFSTIINMTWLDYDFEVRQDFFTAGIMIAHFTDFPDCFYIQTVPGTNVQFWKANGYLEAKNGVYRSRLAARKDWEQLKDSLTYINNPLESQLGFLNKLAIKDKI